MPKHEKRTWKVGNKVIALMPSGVVLIGEPGEFKVFGDNKRGQGQFVIATGIPGAMGVIEALQEVVEEMKARRKADAEARKEG